MYFFCFKCNESYELTRTRTLYSSGSPLQLKSKVCLWVGWKWLKRLRKLISKLKMFFSSTEIVKQKFCLSNRKQKTFIFGLLVGIYVFYSTWRFRVMFFCIISTDLFFCTSIICCMYYRFCVKEFCNEI